MDNKNSDEPQKININKTCKFFIIWNHQKCCMWPAILLINKSPEKLTNGCPENCPWNK